MQVAGEGLAAGADLADQQHRRVVRGNLLHLLAQLLHRAALADRGHQRRDQDALRLPLAPRRLEGLLDGAQQLGQRERLLHEIEGPEARRLHGGLHRAMAGKHDHREAQLLRIRPLAQQRDAVGVRHPDVEQHEVRLLARTRSARLGRVGGHLHLVTLVAEDLPQRLADVRLVVDDEDLG
jgi:hypothetical protein